MIRVVSSFVPINEKLVEVDGNLIMNEIITGEKTSRASFDSIVYRKHIWAYRHYFPEKGT